MDTSGLQIIIPLLTGVSVVAIGAAILVRRYHKRKLVELRLQESTWDRALESSSQERSGFLKFLEKIGNVTSHGYASTSLSEQLIRAGYLSTRAPAAYTGLKMVLFLLGLAGAGMFATTVELPITTKLSLSFVIGFSLFFAPNFVVRARMKKRRDEINSHLPEAIDLLEICVSSGMGLDMAWNMVTNEIHHVSSILAGAMDLTNFEMHLGASRAEAMRHMAERTGADDLSSLAAILIQTEQFGTSIADTLRIFATSMREERGFRAQENAEKMAVKLIIPMVLFIFPAVLIVVVGPAAINLSKMMSTY